MLWVCVYNQLVNFFLPNFSVAVADQKKTQRRRRREDHRKDGKLKRDGKEEKSFHKSFMMMIFFICSLHELSNE
jgi:hypothetical protein